MSTSTNAIFYIAILIMSVVIHEISHGFMAEYFGDKTARHSGRLTLNPIPHLDLFGSIILPAVLILSNAGFLFGWAKPVPYNPDNLSNKRWGTLWVALAGVLANFSIAVIFGTIIRVAPYIFPEVVLSAGFYVITSTIVLINLALGIFNLIPIPPLDGSKILLAFLPEQISSFILEYEQYSFILLLIFIIYFSDRLYPLLEVLFSVTTGLAL